MVYDGIIGKVVMISFGELRKVIKKDPKTNEDTEVMEYPFQKGTLFSYQDKEAILKDTFGRYNLVNNVKKIRVLEDIK